MVDCLVEKLAELKILISSRATIPTSNRSCVNLCCRGWRRNIQGVTLYKSCFSLRQLADKASTAKLNAFMI